MGYQLAVATVSSKFRVILPKEVRDKISLKPGQKVVVFEKDGIINLIPRRRMTEMRGFVKGVTTKDLREEEPSF